jgi:hypothetical protein
LTLKDIIYQLSGGVILVIERQLGRREAGKSRSILDWLYEVFETTILAIVAWELLKRIRKSSIKPKP